MIAVESQLEQHFRGFKVFLSWGAALNAGLERFSGFLHVDRPGKPSLVLDLVEEFRQPVVDRAILSAVNLGIPIRLENGQLNKSSRDLIAGRVLERLVSTLRLSGKAESKQA